MWRGPSLPVGPETQERSSVGAFKEEICQGLRWLGLARRAIHVSSPKALDISVFQQHIHFIEFQ